MNPLRTLLLCLTISLATAPAPPASADSVPAQPGPALEGFWVSRSRFADFPSGTLSIARDGRKGRATLGDHVTDFVFESDGVAFTLAGGPFRGRLADGGRTIRGFWIQPARTSDVTRPFATFVLLRSDGRGRWSGELRPLEDDFTIYLRIFRDSGGQFAASFRNPERGRRGGATRFRMARDGDALRLTAGPDPADPLVTLQGEVLRAPERLRFDWPGLGRPVELTRTSAGEIPAFFPRPPDRAPYAYRRPEEGGDGWRTARGGDVGIDEAGLTALVRKIAGADPTELGAPLIHSVLAAHRGRLVLEEYFYGFDRETAHDLRSAGKTFSSVLLGATIRQGTEIGPDSLLLPLLARRGPFANPDPRKQQIRLSHLMTHASGLACDDYDEASPGHEDVVSSQTGQPDWWRYTLDLPMANDPGRRYAYCSAGMNLMGAALTEATGFWLPELFDRLIAQPLQFGRYHWNLMPSGDGYLGGGAYMRPRDLLKIGQAYLDGGAWNGRRIVDPAWIERSTAPAIQISPATTGLPPEQFGDFYGGGGEDGLAWHLGTVRSGDRTYRAYNASGNGGQILLVLPELDLTVVFTAENYGQGWIWSRWGDEIVGGMLVPAIGGRRK
jgi:CubicO group peptidase (beta-lactamase class C family)